LKDGGMEGEAGKRRDGEAGRGVPPIVEAGTEGGISIGGVLGNRWADESMREGPAGWKDVPVIPDAAKRRSGIQERLVHAPS
jgi:hypothetical protein